MKWPIKALLILGFAMIGAMALIRPNSDNAFPKGGRARDQTKVPAVEAGAHPLPPGDNQSPRLESEHAPSLFHLPHFKTEEKEQHGDLTT